MKKIVILLISFYIMPILVFAGEVTCSDSTAIAQVGQKCYSSAYDLTLFFKL